MLQLDVKTLYFVLGLLATTTGMVLVALSLTGRFDRWLQYWGISNLATGGGILLLTFRDLIPNFYSIVMANMLAILGYFLLMTTTHHLQQRQISWKPHALFLGLLGVLLMLLQDSNHYYTERTILTAIACGFYAINIAKITRNIAQEEDISAAYLVSGIFTFVALSFGLRILAGLTDQLGGDTIFAPGGMNMWMILLAATIAPLWNMSMLLMIMERINRNWIGRALRDPLTAALNRAGLNAAVENNALRRRSDTHATTSLLLVDIDHFKQVNDKLGHAYGDQLLRSFADMVHTQLRGSDLFARQGGDEFVIILPGSGEKQGYEVAERLQKAFAHAATKLKNTDIMPTLSIGIAVTQSDTLPHSLQKLIEQADAALYQSKHSGRNRVTSVQPA
ncbi:GGDEF domain-containing protein [Methylobacillus arboreus]|uniref:GGDEF domain-containing protein n=1 Tax=Methylobacillus arboreus TaxID=755170 RepID=UPI001E46F1C8|nr:GGDEF domain-containing protein [Methylobacillus arboreus]MCB5191707.1 GGDEF domain-containing protein [Methylobacillus arboreus]